MKDTLYLICNGQNVIGMRKTAPPLQQGQIAIKVSVNVPREVFQQYIPSVTINVPESLVLRPSVEVTVEDPA